MKRLCGLLCAVLLLAQGLCAQEVAPFRRDDRVAFVGNSITDGGHYHSYIWLYYMTRFPAMPIRIYNCGIGGDTAAQIADRLEDDVIARRPTVVALTFGMNDTGYVKYNSPEGAQFADERIAESARHFARIEERLLALPRTRIVMLGTSPYDQTAALAGNVALRGKNDAMRRIVELQRTAARRNGWEFTDFNAPMCALNARLQAADSSRTLCGGDRIHPDNDGHMVMAALFLRAQGFDGKPVAEVEIDAREGRRLRAENCSVRRLRTGPAGLSFDYLARALPYPLDTLPRGWGMRRAQSRVMEALPDFMERMNREGLRIEGLSDGEYLLRIDGDSVGRFSAARLAEGINLAAYPHTPQYRQARMVMALNEERWEIERRLRDYIWLQFNFFAKQGLLHANNMQAINAFLANKANDFWVQSKTDLYGRAFHAEVRTAWEREMELLVETIYRVNRPVVRRVTLTPVAR